MKFKLDENFGRRTTSLFVENGHDVHTVCDENLSGSDDQTIFDLCREENRCLVTLDLDFSDVIRFPPTGTDGIMVIRLPKKPSLSSMHALIQHALDYLKNNPIENKLWIIEVGRIRIYHSSDDF
jgi:predicted nuclease of predicted toxin-antitoxin system